AVLPCDDWDAFAQQGAAIYLYRQLSEYTEAGEGTGARHLSLEDLKSKRLPAGFGQTVFAFPPLAPQLEAAGSARVYDLGLLLHQAGKTGAMARSSWLLARDLLGWSPSERQARNVSVAELAKVVTHSCALLGIEDPWLRQGHFRQAVELAYRTQDQILEMQVQTSPTPEQLYYQALRLWHHCGELKPEEIKPALNQMVELLHEYEQKSRQLSEPRSLVREQALHLQSVGEALLHMLSGGGQPEIILRVYAEELAPAPSSVPQEIRLVADLEQAVEAPSRLFRLAFRWYAEIVQRIQRIRTSQIPIDDKIARLQEGIVSLRDARRVAFVHHHERRILDRLYEFAIEQTESLVNELQGSAQLEIELLTQAVAQHEEHALTFLVRNIGRVSAGSVEVDFARSEHFALVEESAVKDLGDLLPESEKRVPFAIRPRVDRDFAVGLKVSYRDTQQQVRVRQQEFLLRIVSLDRGPFRPKPNPYVYGAPLQDHRLFYGRRQELESLLSHLTAGRPQNVLLRGARRAGKTSVLNMLKAIVDDAPGQGHIRKWFQVPDAWYPALDRLQAIPLDLQSVERHQGALTPSVFYQAILGSIRDLGLASQPLSAMLSEPRVTTTLFTKTLEMTLQQYTGTRLVFLLDEFDVVDTITDKTFYAHLRHTISQVQGATWII
ncbi:MAG: ATP-binding protein, partial [Chloroflexota bacterium]